MQGPSNRSVIIISGLLTLIVLSGATAAVAFRNGWVHLQSDGPGPSAVTAGAKAPEGELSGVEHIARAKPSMGRSIGGPQDETAARLATRGDEDRSFADHDGDDDRERSSRRRESRHD